MSGAELLLSREGGQLVGAGPIVKLAPGGRAVYGRGRMLNFLRKRRGDQTARRPGPNAQGPEGVRIYAIGDVHGRLDLFDALIQLIEADRSDGDGETELVLLGDYIDRGPHSAQLLDRLLEGPPPWARWTLLRGNHEQVMLDIIDAEPTEDPDRFERLVSGWLKFGGREALESYGAGALLAFGNDLYAVAEFLRARVPGSHVALIRKMPLAVRRGDYVFVHAGVRPGIPLDAQEADDLIWIRDEFLNANDDFGAVIVHGHSVRPEPELRANRVGIDTGAFASGRLTAAVIDGSSLRILQTGD